MIRLQRCKLLTLCLIGVLLTGSFGAAASAAEAGASVPGESFHVSGEMQAEEVTESAKAGPEEEPAAESDAGSKLTQDEDGKSPESGDQSENGIGSEDSDQRADSALPENGGQPENGVLPMDSEQRENGEQTNDAGRLDDAALTESGGQAENTDLSGNNEQPEDASTPEDAAATEGAATPEDAAVGDAAVTEDAAAEEENVLEAPVITEIPGAAALSGIEETPSVTVLGSPRNLEWKDTTTLSWDAVENAGRYRVTVYLKKGTLKYSKYLFVYGKTEYDLEDEIVSLIKTNRKNITGASYTISAAVQAQSTDPARFQNGKSAASPSFRYMRTTYLEALERNGWYSRNGYWYYYEGGAIQTGWISFGGERYYLNKDGIMLKSRWINDRYLRSDGAMAKNEWVDNYKCYVGQDGRVVDSVTFSGKNWVQTKAGWRYKKSDGKYVKNTWYPVGHRVYYFDDAGHMVTGWLKLDGNTYYLKNSGDIMTGRGARQSGWLQVGSSYYWFDKNGVMAKSQWVDKGQYYVNAAGRRQSWISYAALRNVNTSNRLGYDVYSSSSPPEQSIAAYDLAYQNGNRILVVDLRFTKDNVPVCFHDDIVSYARLENGKVPAKKPTVSEMTYSELCAYDYGIYRGAKYKGTAPLTLGMMAAWIRRHSDADIYIEVKADTMTAAQVQSLAEVINTNGITDQCSTIFTVVSANDTRAKRVHRLVPTMRIGITTHSVGTLAYSQFDQVKGSNETFLWGWNTSNLSASIVSTLKSKDVLYESGIFTDDLDNILSYYSKGSPNVYNSGVETPGAVFKTLLSAATFHDKAQWVSTDKGWKYQKVDKTFLKNSWLTLSGKKYYLNGSGIMQTGWLNLSGKLYYLESNGAMVTGWKYVGDKRYYFDASGLMLTGKQVLNGHTYLFDSTGKYIKKIN